jgi:hypothetical protein
MTAPRNATCNSFDPVFDGPADDPANYCNDCGAVAAAHSKPAAAAPHFHAGRNDAGYLPEAEVATFATFEDAKTYMIGELLEAADNVASWAEPHDCDDIPCPTFGDDCPEQLGNAAALEAESLNLESGPEWQAYLSDGRSLPVSWWITPCAEDDCDGLDELEDDSTIRAEIGTTGEIGEVEVSGNAGSDIAQAVKLEHPNCEQNTCDVSAALEAGYPMAAAYLLDGATEAPLLAAVVMRYFPAAGIRDDAVMADFDAWCAYAKAHSRQCQACEAWLYVEGVESEWCGNCGEEVPAVPPAYLEAAMRGYLECALWSSTDEDGKPLDSAYSVDDIGQDWIEEARGEVVDFLADNWADVADLEAAQVGHDFWLTRNRHGAGFWDRGLGERGQRLTDAAHAYGESDLELRPPSFWQLLEDPPKRCAEVAALWSWSLNYDAGRGPATLFLDLIGYSQDEYGQALYNLADASLGYRELEYLRDAMTEYLADPHAVRGFVSTLLEAEATR